MGQVLPVEQLLKEPQHQIGCCREQEQQQGGQVQVHRVPHHRQVPWGKPADEEQEKSGQEKGKGPKTQKGPEEPPAGKGAKGCRCSQCGRTPTPKKGQPQGLLGQQAHKGTGRPHRGAQRQAAVSHPQVQGPPHTPQQKKIHIQVGDGQHIGVNCHSIPPVTAYYKSFPGKALSLCGSGERQSRPV